MTLQARIILIIAKLAQQLVRILGFGGGSALPGLIAQRIQPDILTQLRLTVLGDIVCISGTNGKTSTANQIATSLQQTDKQVLHNKNGSNLERGIISAFITSATWQGSLPKIDVAIFECDEAALLTIVPKLKPSILVLTNLFRDQLDRYGEIESTRKKWENMLTTINWPLQLIYNAADPQLHALATNNTFSNITIQQLYLTNLHPQKEHHTSLNPLTNIHCPNCNTILTFVDEIIIGQGTYTCRNCKFTNQNLSATMLSAITYKAINNMLAKTTLLALNIQPLANEIPTEVFGRGELIQVNQQQWNIVLIKNPNGAYQAIKESLLPTQDTIIFALNDNFADGTDVSWIWDIPLEELLPHDKPYFTTGTRTLDIALRLKYFNILTKPIQNWDELSPMPYNNLIIFATYTAMLNLQQWLSAKGYKKSYWK